MSSSKRTSLKNIENNNSTIQNELAKLLESDKLTEEETSDLVINRDIDIEKIFTDLEPGIELVLKNDFTGVSELLKKDRHCYIHILALTLFRGAIAGITMDKSRFKLAQTTAWKGLAIAKQHRKKDSTFFFSNTDANSYTDNECIAELLYCEYNGAYGILNVVDDQSIMGFIKGAYRVRICYNGFKLCEKLMNEKTNWTNEYLKREFESGVLLGLGLFEMGISFVPRKFMLLLELAGYSSSRTYGLQQIEKSSKIEESKYHKLAAKGAIVLYYLFLENFYGLGEVRKDLIMDNIKFGRNLVLESHYLVLADGLLQFVGGEFDKAEENFTLMIEHPSNPRALRYALCWVQSWVAVIQSDWDSAVYHATILKNECKWSRALFSYMHGIFLYMQMDKEKSNDEKVHQQMIESLSNVPKLKRNFGGKRAFHEKLVIERSKQFVNSPQSMILPHLDLMYLWNLMSLANSNKILLEKLIEDITTTYNEKKEKKLLSVDTKCYLIFMKGVAKSILGEDSSASECFMKVIQSANQLTQEVHLVPQSCLELGLMYRRSKDNDEATLWLKKAKKYQGYLTESMIQFRADCALRSIKSLE